MYLYKIANNVAGKLVGAVTKHVAETGNATKATTQQFSNVAKVTTHQGNVANPATQQFSNVAKATTHQSPGTKNIFNDAAFWRNGWNATMKWIADATKGTDIKNAFAGEKPNWGLAAKGAAKMGVVYGVPAVGAYTFLKGNTNTNSLQSGTTT